MGHAYGGSAQIRDGVIVVSANKCIVPTAINTTMGEHQFDYRVMFFVVNAVIVPDAAAGYQKEQSSIRYGRLQLAIVCMNELILCRDRRSRENCLTISVEDISADIILSTFLRNETRKMNFSVPVYCDWIQMEFFPNSGGKFSKISCGKRNSYLSMYAIYYQSVAIAQTYRSWRSNGIPGLFAVIIRQYRSGVDPRSLISSHLVESATQYSPLSNSDPPPATAVKIAIQMVACAVRRAIFSSAVSFFCLV
jgi:hypothetical protein